VATAATSFRADRVGGPHSARKRNDFLSAPVLDGFYPD
jgi:hypothetical protein